MSGHGHIEATADPADADLTVERLRHRSRRELLAMAWRLGLDVAADADAATLVGELLIFDETTRPCRCGRRAAEVRRTEYSLEFRCGCRKQWREPRAGILNLRTRARSRLRSWTMTDHELAVELGVSSAELALALQPLLAQGLAVRTRDGLTSTSSGRRPGIQARVRQPGLVTAGVPAA